MCFWFFRSTSKYYLNGNKFFNFSILFTEWFQRAPFLLLSLFPSLNSNILCSYNRYISDLRDLHLIQIHLCLKIWKVSKFSFKVAQFKYINSFAVNSQNITKHKENLEKWICVKNTKILVYAILLANLQKFVKRLEVLSHGFWCILIWQLFLTYNLSKTWSKIKLGLLIIVFSGGGQIVPSPFTF